jgi:hypothetical protein
MRYLSHELWATVKETVEAMPLDTERVRLLSHLSGCRGPR